MSNAETEISKKYVFLQARCEKILDHKYFKNLNIFSINTFLISIYNINILLKEHLLHLGILLTKIPNDNDLKIIIKVLYNNAYNKNKNSVLETFNDFIAGFMDQLKSDKSYISENYYKKYSISNPIDKICNEFSNILLNKSWEYCIASMATFEYIMILINKQFNNFAHKTIDAKIYLSETSNNAFELINIIPENEDDIYSAVIKVVELFSNMFDNINIIFDES